MRRVKRLLTFGVPFWTDRSVSGNKWGGAAKADIDNPEAGFRTLLWKQPLHGAVSNVWLKIDSDGPKWVIVDPVRPVVPAGGLINSHNETQPLDAGWAA